MEAKAACILGLTPRQIGHARWCVASGAALALNLERLRSGC
jgi:hypothetical protein